MNKKFTSIGISTRVKENLVYLRSLIEAHIRRVSSFDEVMFYITYFLIKKLENDDFEKEFKGFIEKVGGKDGPKE